MLNRLLIGGLFLSTSLLIAADQTQKEPSPDHLFLGIGAFDVNRSHPRLQFQVEYRWDVQYHGLRPLVGAMATLKGSSYYFAGAGWDIPLGKYFILTPSFAPGIYSRGGKGKNLGFPLEFRSSIELAYQTKNHTRIGAQYYHISNASLSHKNPGEESLIFFYQIPIHRVKKNSY